MNEGNVYSLNGTHGNIGEIFGNLTNHFYCGYSNVL